MSEVMSKADAGMYRRVVSYLCFGKGLQRRGNYLQCARWMAPLRKEGTSMKVTRAGLKKVAKYPFVFVLLTNSPIRTKLKSQYVK